MGRNEVNDLFLYFVNKYGKTDTDTFKKAQLNFIRSMAAYSVACYILQIKDRHNGNIMIDAEGHIVHIGKSKTNICQMHLRSEHETDRIFRFRISLRYRTRRNQIRTQQFQVKPRDGSRHGRPRFRRL